MFSRPVSNILFERLNESRRFIQALIGPRQILSRMGSPSHYASADEPVLRDRVWIEQQWETARLTLNTFQNAYCEKVLL